MLSNDPVAEERFPVTWMKSSFPAPTFLGRSPRATGFGYGGAAAHEVAAQAAVGKWAMKHPFAGRGIWDIVRRKISLAGMGAVPGAAAAAAGLAAGGGAVWAHAAGRHVKTASALMNKVTESHRTHFCANAEELTIHPATANTHRLPRASFAECVTVELSANILWIAIATEHGLSLAAQPRYDT
jgi:hypothetical protein